MCLIAQPVQNMAGRGVAQKNVGCLMELYEDVLQNSLHLISQFNWLGAYCSAAIIMIFVSCSNIYGYLQNYQDCLTLDELGIKQFDKKNAGKPLPVWYTFYGKWQEPLCSVGACGLCKYARRRVVVVAKNNKVIIFLLPFLLRGYGVGFWGV
jgi:hypothetical protein